MKERREKRVVSLVDGGGMTVAPTISGSRERETLWWCQWSKYKMKRAINEGYLFFSDWRVWRASSPREWAATSPPHK
ncbi:hypothetical protein HanIR_Chr05g0250291 [Helianthus annuus]|nr:hypothetical protein HanIR_Chr05g0250291 [Helianthus annuus]